jgi:hypothetical protein
VNREPGNMRGQPTKCGTYRYCSACGDVPVALKHTETRCYACQQDKNDTKRGDDASEMED